MVKNLGENSIVPGTNSPIAQNLSYALLKTAAKKEISEKTYTMLGIAKSDKERYIQRIIAHNKFKSRLQMGFAYLKAETENRLLVGSINKTEWSTGLFTKFGYDHSTDLMPLRTLYRTQILELAGYMQLPEEICNIAKVDLLPGIENKYHFFFDLPVTDVDSILIRLSNGIALEEIKEQTGISFGAIEKVKYYFNSAGHQRAGPLAPKI